jgi:LCP family protein required for cell wall assembly
MRGGADGDAVANRSGLEALGQQIDSTKGRGHRGRRGPDGLEGKPKWSTQRKVVAGLISLVVLAVVVIGAGYGYLRYEFDQINTAPCPDCTQVADGAPYNVLVIGSDTRDGETAAEAKQFGSSATAGGQRSDTIKIVHVDPQTGTASTLSIPRDTFVDLSGVPASSGVSTKNKINAAFATGPNDPDPSGTGANGLVKTIENTFGIPISHWIVVNFFGLMDAVQALGGVSMDVPYPVRDYGDCNGNGVFENCTGLNIPTIGCQTLSGTQALELSRSRHFEWYQDGWQSDLSGDLGRIERQDLMIEAVVNKAKSTYNPVRAVSFISSMTHDVTLDKGLGATALLSLAEKYHAFSGNSLTNFTLPTSGAAYAPYGDESVEVVTEPAAAIMINQFLGGAPNEAPTPPLNQYGDPEDTSVPSTTAPPVTSTPTTGSGHTTTTAKPSEATSSTPAYDPRPC